jgi:hypothetical protein
MILQSTEAHETVFLQTEVQYSESGGSAHLIFSDSRRKQGRSRYSVSLGAEMIAELIPMLTKVLESENANWEFTFVQAPNPKHRPGE